MSIRSWVAGKLENMYACTPTGERGLYITREARRAAVVYCAEPDETARFTAGDLNAACRELPGLQFVVLIRRDADNKAYQRAEELGVCLGGLGDLKSALHNDANIAQHRNSEQAYLLGRLANNRHVAGVRRCGKCAYEITRKAAHLDPLTIMVTDEYELTSDGIYEMLDQNNDIDFQAIVSTSPACSGFAGEAMQAGKQTGIEILSLRELLDMLGDRWT
jgi:hypothetical protein